jgi:hypothetical protein
MRSKRFAAVLTITTLLTLFLGFGSAVAEEVPRAEIYLGYAGIVGFNGSAALNLNRWIGMVGDYSYRVAEYHADKPLQTFTAGPKVSLRLVPRITPFAHALFGGAGSSCASFSNSGCRSGIAFAFVLGGGVDIQIGKDVSIRAIQIDKIRTHFGDRANTYTGVSFGVVGQLGRLFSR